MAYRHRLFAETVAALLLRLKGHRIVARRYKTPVGEIDLVALKVSSLVTCNNNSSSSGGGVTIKARVIVPKSEIAHGVRVMLNHADTFYVNKDGSFEL